MKVMVLVKNTPETEDRLPCEQALRDMGAFNERLLDAGVLLAGEGLHPTARGRRVRFEEGGGHAVTDGPFTETRELLGGYWLWQVRSLDEATEWVKAAPFDAGMELELRPVMSMEDFGEAFTPALREREARLRELTGTID